MATLGDDFKSFKSIVKKILSNKFSQIMLLIIGVPFIFTLMYTILRDGLFEAFDIPELFKDFFEYGRLYEADGVGYIAYTAASLIVCHHIIKILKGK